jgi:hypothetical protein
MSFDVIEQLALYGGPKAKRTPSPKGKRHSELEKKYLNEVIDSDMLFFYMGTKVRALEKRFAEMYGMKHCIACSSGTAAVHMAVAALELSVGNVIITSAITDMGSLTGVLYQGLVPVFADVDPDTLNRPPRRSGGESPRRPVPSWSCITPASPRTWTASSPSAGRRDSLSWRIAPRRTVVSIRGGWRER